jgi:hypothetical protein
VIGVLFSGDILANRIDHFQSFDIGVQIVDNRGYAVASWQIGAGHQSNKPRGNRRRGRYNRRTRLRPVVFIRAISLICLIPQWLSPRPHS